jgi:hypothetical protein
MASGRPRVYESVVANWPIKLTALGLAAVLWAGVAAEEPSTRRIAVSLEVRAPEGRPLTHSLPSVHAVFAGPARELLKLYGSRPVIRIFIPDSMSGSSYTVPLGTSDIEIANNVEARAESIEPSSITLALETTARGTEVAADVAEAGPVSERVLMGIPITIRGERGSTAWSSDPPAVIVTVRGRGSRIRHLTRDSVEVSALPDGSGGPETVKLEVAAPPGVDARAVPDSAVVQRRTRG